MQQVKWHGCHTNGEVDGYRYHAHSSGVAPLCLMRSASANKINLGDDLRFLDIRLGVDTGLATLSLVISPQDFVLVLGHCEFEIRVKIRGGSGSTYWLPVQEESGDYLEFGC